MKAKEFFRLNLQVGDKVRVAIDGLQPAEAFFDGYKTWEHIIRNPDYDLLPVFRAVTKKGKMGRSSPWEGRGPGECFFNIVSCTKTGDTDKRYTVTLFNMNWPSETRKETIRASSQEEAERAALSGGLINLQSGWGVLGSRRMPEKDDVKEFFFIPEEHRKYITDSLLLDSDQVVLSGTVDDVRVTVIVCGEVRIGWKGQIYKYASQFPDDLTEAIRNHTFRVGGDEDDENFIGNNNWYEVRVWKNKKLLHEDYVDMDINDMTDDDAKNFVIDVAGEYLDANKDEVEKE